MSLELIYYDLPVSTKVTYSGECPSFCLLSHLGSKRVPDRIPYNPVITLEPDGWVLNGRYVTPKIYAPPPFWGTAMSDEAGELSEPAVVTVQLSQPCTASGVTLIFWEDTNQWCSRIQVSWYAGDTLLEQQTLYPDSPRLVVQKLVRDFDRLELSLEKTSQPYRFPKLTYLKIGQEITFSGDSLTAVTLLTEHDPTGCELRADTMTVEVHDEKHIIAPQESQPVELYRDGTLIAKQNLTCSRRTDEHSYVLTAQSMIGHLEEQFLGGIYEGELVSNMLEIIMDSSSGWYADAALRNLTVSGYLPVCTRREALQQLAFVVGARVVTADGTVRLLSMEQETTGEFLPEEIFSGAQLETQNKLVKLELTAHSYELGTEQQVLMENVYVDGDGVILTFDTPCQDCWAEDCEVVECGANYIKVNAHGPIRVTGTPYVHTAVIHSRRLSGSGRVLTVDNVTLVNNSNVEAVMDRVLAAAAHRQKLTQDVVLQSQFAGQQVKSPTPWGSTLQGWITSVEARMTPRGQTATVTLQGSETD